MRVWAAGIDYIVGDEVAYPDASGALYTCNQAHTCLLYTSYNYKDGSATITPKEIEEAFGSDLTQVAPPQFV